MNINEESQHLQTALLVHGAHLRQEDTLKTDIIVPAAVLPRQTSINRYLQLDVYRIEHQSMVVNDHADDDSHQQQQP